MRQRSLIALPSVLVTESQILARHSQSTKRHLLAFLATDLPNDSEETEKSYLADADSIERE